MAKKLVIVESPAKARTLGRILGSGYVIKASMGHVRDLPKGALGIDIEHDFAPQYVNISLRRKTINELKASTDNASAIYLATDPDREGEAISWHLIQAAKLNKDKVPIHRVVFHEITDEAVEQAFKHPRSIDMNLVDAQQARRLLDRLVGYKLSPLLWKKVQRGLSAGRVQSAAVKIIVDREREIENFISIEYWVIEAELAKKLAKTQSTSFRALFIGLANGTTVEIPNEDKAKQLRNELEHAEYIAKSVDVKEVSRQPAPPFTTSTLQQEAWRRLRFTAKRTMVVAQQLYEGITIGDEGSVGLITYMRTDSTNVAASAIAETRDFINSKYGSDFVPHQPRSFSKKGKWTQEAHEAIRPTRIQREPDQLRAYLKPEQFRLYELIWKRMVASQMSAALFDSTKVNIEAKSLNSTNKYLLRTISSAVKFPGFMLLYSEGKDEDTKEEKAISLPELKAGDKLVLIDVFLEQCFTQPLPRFTEATLIKALEQNGIGRPSTYAPILSTIQERGYVHKDGGRFCPDEIGIIVNDLLTENFPRIVNLNFTAQMEENLDEIAQGKKEWVSVLRGFYTPFSEKLKKATETLQRINTDKESGEICPECGKPMVIKNGRFGRFLACSGYPACKKTMPLLVKIGVLCPECGKSNGGEIIEKLSKKKRRFYSCSRYPQCKFAIRQKPIARPCPQCGNLLVHYRNGVVRCIDCKYKGDLTELETAGAIS
jgi:DNA topoisomerase-1